MSSEQPSPATIRWHLGTAYDFFISLTVLHHPDRFGLRPSWAAGVRSRLGQEERKTLEQADQLFRAPLQWVYGLDEPRDSMAALWALRQIPAEERLPALTFYPGFDAELMNLLRRVANQGHWEDGDTELLREAYRREHHEALRPKSALEILSIWAQADLFGERYLAALQAYQQAFFAEEEARIQPALKEALAQAQEMAERLTAAELFEQLSQGVIIPDLLERRELVFAPSYWCTPLIFIRKLDERRAILSFGARPAEASLVPGDAVPDALLQALKAMADPTRLRILRYLTHAPLTPAELARRLRLRAPTVTHHLSALRLAGLVQITLDPDDQGGSERHYTARKGSVERLQKQVQSFLESDQTDG
jgi:DNA-binding transcriptional ArsR family regulator